MSATQTSELAASYVDAWKRKDFGAIRRHLAPSVHLKGPMMEATGITPVGDSIERILPMLQEFDLRAIFITGVQAMLAYDFICPSPIGRCRTAELVTFSDGLIKEIELFYDARPFERAAPHRGRKS